MAYDGIRRATRNKNLGIKRAYDVRRENNIYLKTHTTKWAYAVYAVKLFLSQPVTA